jgi:ABC-type sulfate transport system permease component
LNRAVTAAEQFWASCCQVPSLSVSCVATVTRGLLAPLPMPGFELLLLLLLLPLPLLDTTELNCVRSLADFLAVNSSSSGMRALNSTARSGSVLAAVNLLYVTLVMELGVRGTTVCGCLRMERSV